MTLAARIRRLSVAFHERTILHDITLDIPAEGITVLLGRSGSGKTTFLRALNARERPHSPTCAAA